MKFIHLVALCALCLFFSETRASELLPFERQQEDRKTEKTVTLIAPKASPGLIGSMQTFIRLERERFGFDQDFTEQVLVSLREARTREMIEPVVLTELKSVECTRSACELVLDAAYLGNPGRVDDTVRVALENQGIELRMVRSEVSAGRNELHVFVIRPAFAQSALHLD